MYPGNEQLEIRATPEQVAAPLIKSMAFARAANSGGTIDPHEMASALREQTAGKLDNLLPPLEVPDAIKIESDNYVKWQTAVIRLAATEMKENQGNNDYCIDVVEHEVGIAGITRVIRNGGRINEQDGQLLARRFGLNGYTAETIPQIAGDKDKSKQLKVLMSVNGSLKDIIALSNEIADEVKQREQELPKIKRVNRSSAMKLLTETVRNTSLEGVVAAEISCIEEADQVILKYELPDTSAVFIPNSKNITKRGKTVTIHINRFGPMSKIFSNLNEGDVNLKHLSIYDQLDSSQQELVESFGLRSIQNIAESLGTTNTTIERKLKDMRETHGLTTGRILTLSASLGFKELEPITVMPRFTPFEESIILSIADGLSFENIAALHNIDSKDFKKFYKKVSAQTGIKTADSAVRYALRAGIMELPEL